jgi:hypothetical protein
MKGLIDSAEMQSVGYGFSVFSSFVRARTTVYPKNPSASIHLQALLQTTYYSSVCALQMQKRFRKKKKEFTSRVKNLKLI